MDKARERDTPVLLLRLFCYIALCTIMRSILHHIAPEMLGKYVKYAALPAARAEGV
jgi:hypothetical protein